jgi:hypothetical protein
MSGANERSGAAAVRARSGAPVLRSSELLVLQLRARGYQGEQAATLIGMRADALEQVERSASAALGVSGVEEAVAVALRRGLVI